MKCVICHSDDIRTKAVYEEIARGDDVVRIPIETLVCANCGERYYDRHTMRRLEQIRQSVKEEEIDLCEIGKVLVCKGRPS